MERQYELSEEKLIQMATCFVQKGGFPFNEMIGIVCEIPVQPYFYDDISSYPTEIGQDIARFRELANRFSDLFHTGAPVFEKLMELQANTTEINNEIADLLIEDAVLLKEITPVTTEFFSLLEKLKEGGLK